MEEYISTLSKTRLFAGIDGQELAALAHCLSCTRRSFQRGATLQSRGERVRSAGIVLAGSVRAVKLDYDGAELLVNRFSQGDIFGDVLMASGNSQSPVSIIAESDCEVLYIPLERIMSDCGRGCDCHVRLRMNLLGEIADKFWGLHRRLDHLGIYRIRARLARFLLDAAGEGSSATPHMNREELASYLCVDRSALSRELSRMEEQGLIIREGKGFLLNKKELEYAAKR